MNVDRQDYFKGLEPWVVRVRLDTAIQFIRDLLQKEQNASEEECQRAARM